MSGKSNSTLSPKMQMNKTRQAGNASLLVDKTLAMKHSERTSYLYRSYVKPPPNELAHVCPDDLALWREKMTHWTFSVIDHFHLSRRTVAISMDLFDRYLATQGNRCDGDNALLISLTTLYIAIKVHEKKKIKLCTLSELSRGRFEPTEIEEMEMKIVQNLAWLLHPPTPIDFISHVLRFLPPCVSMPARHGVFEVARYMVELSICDPFFVDVHASTIAFAAILNVLSDDIDYDTVSKESRQRFFLCLHRDLGLHRGRPQVRASRQRLRTMVNVSKVDHGFSCEGMAQNAQYAISRVSSNSSSYAISRVSSSSSESANSKRSIKSGRSRCDSFDSVESTNTLASGRSYLSQWENIMTPN